MKKVLVLFMTAAMAASLLIGCGESKTAEVTAEETITETATMEEATESAANYLLINDGILTVGVDDTMPPMEYRDDANELVGFDIDMGGEIANRLGLKIQWVPTDWDGLLLGLSSEKYDVVISTINITDERKETMDFSDPYYVLEELVIARADDDSISSLADIQGKRVGCQTGSANYVTLTEMENVDEADISQYNAVTDELQDVISGRLDCAVMESPTAFYYTQINDKLKLLSNDPIEGHDVGITFNKGNESLVAAVNKVLDEMRADGTLSDISVKWFGENIYAE